MTRPECYSLFLKTFLVVLRKRSQGVDCDYLREKRWKKGLTLEERGNGDNACCFDDSYQQRDYCNACYLISSAAKLIAVMILIKMCTN